MNDRQTLPENKHPKTGELLAAMSAWSSPLLDHPAFRRFVRAKIGAAMEWEDPWPRTSEKLTEVVLPQPLAGQHEAVLQFYNLWQAAERLKSVEYYFRRFPFSGLPINKHEHLENTCVLYFSYFYVVEERMTVFLNALNAAVAPSKVEVGHALKLYRKWFKVELRARHDTIHLEPFDDLAINAVMLSNMRDGRVETTRRSSGEYAYRKAAKEWANHARAGGERISDFLELLADATLKVAGFLATPPSPGPDELSVR